MNVCVSELVSECVYKWLCVCVYLYKCVCVYTRDRELCEYVCACDLSVNECDYYVYASVSLSVSVSASDCKCVRMCVHQRPCE